jgi:myxalamid-type polyketide synthase MxaE and MxaD
LEPLPEEPASVGEPGFVSPVPPEATGPVVEQPAAATGPTGEAIQQWLVQWVTQQAGLGEHPIDPQEPLASFGMDSVSAVLLVDDLEKWLGRRFQADLAWRYPTLGALSQHLLEQLRAP